MQLAGRWWEGRFGVAAGGTEIVVLPAAARVAVSTEPGASGTATVDYSVSPTANVNGGSATWLPLIDAAATTAEAGRTTPTRALRLSAIGAPATFDVLQWAAD